MNRSSIFIEGARTELVIFFSCVLGRQKENRKEQKGTDRSGKRTKGVEKREQKNLCFNSLSRCIDFLHCKTQKVTRLKPEKF